MPRTRSRTKEVIGIRKVDRDAFAYAATDDDFDLEKLVLNWVTDRVPDLDIRGAITGLSIERTIEGASTVEISISDPDSRLFAGSRMWTPKPKKGAKRTREYDLYGKRITRPQERGRATDIKLDGIVYRLVKVSKSGDTATLVFEDRIIYWLRRKRGSFRRKRAKITRAQFILALLRQVRSERVRYVCPELNVRQPIERRAATAATTTSRHNKSSRGVADTRLTVQGKKATAEQRRIGSRALAVADELNAGPKPTLALMEACIVESWVRNIPFGHSSSVGVLQLLNIHGSVQRRLNVEWVVKQFLTKGFTGRGGAISLAKRNPNRSAGWVAQQVQGSAYPERYDQVADEAREWVQAYAGSGADVSEANAAGGATRYRSFQYARERDEDSWSCMQRLAGEVGWRCFLQGRSLFYMSEADLFRRLPLYKFTPDNPAVLSFDFDIDWGKRVSEVRAQVTAGPWKCPPGEPVLVDGFGPADGRWLVTSWRRDYFSPVIEITLKQPARETMEPAAETVGAYAGEASGLVSGVSSDGSAPRTVMRAYNRAEAIDRKNQGYVWGGGHGTFNDSRGYDCSGFVSSCLHAAGLLSSPQTTVGLRTWGESGQGKYMTVWVKETGVANMSHTFMTFKLRGRTRYAEAGGNQSSHTGWHSPRSHAGFQPRHWPGT